jgi:hypothetical protein
MTPSETIEGLVTEISPPVDKSFPPTFTKLLPPLVREIAPDAVSTIPAVFVDPSLRRAIFPVDCVFSPPIKSIE